MFDLPVTLDEERKAATGFRNTLLDLGFEMMQFSVYMRFCGSDGEVDTYAKRVEAALPSGGRVNLVSLTDKQYERIRTYYGHERQPEKKPPSPYDLF